MNSISFIAQTFERALNNESTNPSQIIPKDSSAHLTSSQKGGSVSDINDNRIDLETESLLIQEDSPTTSSNDENTNTIHTHQEGSLSLIVRIFLFIPNLLIIRPLLFTWFIITFPLNLLERKKSNSTKNNNEGTTSASSTSSKEIEYTDKDTKDPNQTDSEPSSGSPSPSLSPALSSQNSNTTIPELDEETQSLISDSKIAIDLKSPTSPASSSLSHINSKFLTFPKFVFPRNLINSNAKKTLILDLDETLVHSLSRGTRMSNGHMVEVKLNSQVATLYYVHKRPYCDLFLKQVSKWYNLVIFTASVKEYADPVIDYLESERSYFQNRYYRDHCTLRDGQGYIKDLSSVDKNLNNVIIIDNSPISYALHENNAIIVEGWINDPSDSDLLNLIPLLNGLRYATDVRAVLGLKNGEIALEK